MQEEGDREEKRRKLKQGVLQRGVISLRFLVLQIRETSANCAPFPLSHPILQRYASAESLENSVCQGGCRGLGCTQLLAFPLWCSCSKDEEVLGCRTGSSRNPIAQVQQHTPLQGAFIFQKWSLFPVASGKHMPPNQYMVSNPCSLYYKASVIWGFFLFLFFFCCSRPPAPVSHSQLKN